MALDGAYLSLLAREIREKVGEARIDKISQPTRDTLVVSLRWKGGGGKLLLCAGAEGTGLLGVLCSPHIKPEQEGQHHG